MVGAILEKTGKVGSGANVVAMIQLLAPTGCRRGEIINFRWEEVDETKGCFRLRDTKEGRSIRPIGCRRGGEFADANRPRLDGYV